MSLSKFDHLAKSLDELGRLGRDRRLVTRIPNGLQFRQDGHTIVNFGSNDYLGLAQRQQQRSAYVGSGASALVCGWTDHHERLADTIARLESTEAAVVFPSGFAACSGTMATLPQAGDLILSDELNHASIIDGCRLSRADCIVYPHRDTNTLQNILSTQRSKYVHVWMVTDSVFSMDGHIAPLHDLCDIAEQFDANVVVDEAHATGVLGEHGSGACEALDVKSRVPVRIGTLSKAIGSQGGFVAGPRVVIDYLINRCRTLIFSTSLSPAATIAAIESFERLQSEPELRNRVTALAKEVRLQLSLPPVSELEAAIPIIPLMVGAERKATELSGALLKLGYYVPAIRPPTVPDGTSRLRISVSAGHSDEMVDGLIEAINQVR
ncbi:8-amino-7-oxononanoate synthase [Rubripirellula amarantea]|uniref:8-amino-7-oxononanoate synthase n=1 Tax=Rubripirellula amarantea TaxID=2527999 RepID=A0A5C5WRK4_9BACT|nr:8-amino-7-oxononanoate synthase [Rubripirellula amarantea]